MICFEEHGTNQILILVLTKLQENLLRIRIDR
jgi:hypothetical protein